MLAALPTPYPDELLYSLVARYGRRFRFPNRKSLAGAFFGNRNAVAVVDLPTRLGALAAAIPGRFGLGVPRLIDDHTHFPYHAPFLPCKRVVELWEAMREFGDVHLRAGLAASRVRPPERLRYCPVCAAEDRAAYGERYWHRLHQVPGVAVCHRHQVRLEDSPVKTFLRRERHRFVAADEVVPHDATVRPVTPGDEGRVLLELAEDSAWLLSRPATLSDPWSLSGIYRHFLAEAGLARHSGTVRVQLVLERFAAHYPPEVLVQLQSPSEKIHLWLPDLVRTTRGKAQHPLRHLLLARFLGLSAESLFAFSVPPPFGHGPWPCLNPVCPDQHSLCITDIAVGYTKDRGEPVATFECPRCGFAYSRTGRDREPEDRYRRDRVVAFGPVWEEALIVLWYDSKVGLREAARRLGVDPRTVQLRMMRKKSEVVTRGEARVDAHAHRRAWETLRAAYPELGRKALRQRLPRTYTWLYRNDRAWLDAHSPAPRRAARPRQKVDWQRLDADLAAAVPAAAKTLKEDVTEKPRRVTVTSLARALGQLHNIQKKADKLSETVAALKREAETREAFAVRRIRYTATLYRREGQYPKAWQLVRRAGLRKELLEHEVVGNALRDAMADLHSRASVGR